MRLACLSVFGLGVELCDLLADLLVHARLQFRAVAQEEQDLEPHEHGSEEEGLDDVVQEGGGAALEGAVADELEDPARHMDGDGILEGGVRVGQPHVVAKGGGSQADGREDEAGHGLQQQVERRVERGCDGAEVEVQVGEGEPGWQADQRPCVCCLGE